MNLGASIMGRRNSSATALWREALLWTLCCLPVLHALLLSSISDPHSSQAIAIQLLRPVGILGALLLFGYAAWIAPDRRRWSWVCLAVAMLFSLAFSFLRVILDLPPSLPLLKILVVLIYLCSLVGGALYLQQHSLWVGSTLRVIMGGITVGYASWVGMQSLSAKIPLWHSQAAAFLPYLAFDMGILFALGVVGLRYGLRGRPILFPFLMSMICLLSADALYLTLILTPQSLLLLWAITPLYTLHNVLLALAAYRDVTAAPQRAAVAAVMPFSEWLLWTFAPLVAVSAAFVAASVIGNVSYRLIAGLLLASVIHEALAALDYRRVFSNLRLANEQVRSEAATTEAFVARIIHDVAPPVQGLTSILQDKSWRKDQQSLRELAASQITLLETFIQQTRFYLQARTFHLEHSALPLLPICLAAVDAATLLAQQRGIRIVQDVAIDAPMVGGDAIAIRRILDNLLTNAVRISPTGAEVTVSITEPTADQIEVAVQDRGPGIPAEKLVNIFKPYTSLQSPTSDDKEGRHPSPTGTGMGLGLAIVKELTTALGGTCGVSSTPGAGSTFYVRLPRWRHPA